MNLRTLLDTYRRARELDELALEGVNGGNVLGDALADRVEAMMLTPLDRQLIDQHFACQELQRSYSVSGIYQRVQAFIDDGLEQERAKHDDECEMRDGFRRWCYCVRRRECLRCKGMGYGPGDRMWCESCGGSIEQPEIADV